MLAFLILLLHAVFPPISKTTKQSTCPASHVEDHQAECGGESHASIGAMLIPSASR